MADAVRDRCPHIRSPRPRWEDLDRPRRPGPDPFQGWQHRHVVWAAPTARLLRPLPRRPDRRAAVRNPGGGLALSRRCGIFTNRPDRPVCPTVADAGDDDGLTLFAAAQRTAREQAERERAEKAAAEKAEQERAERAAALATPRPRRPSG